MERIKFVITLLLIELSSYSFGQQSDCKTVLLECISSMSSIKTVEPGKVYFIDMSIHSDLKRPNPAIPTSVNVKTYMTSSQISVETNKMVIYYDEYDSFSIIPESKTIIWSNGGKVKDQASRALNLENMQKDVVQKSNIKGCSNNRFNNKDVKSIVLDLPADITKTTKVESIEFTIDINDKRIVKVNSKFSSSNDISSQEIIYNELDYNYKKWKPLPVKERVFKNNKLLPQFNGYRLINNKK